MLTARTYPLSHTFLTGASFDLGHGLGGRIGIRSRVAEVKRRRDNSFGVLGLPLRDITSPVSGCGLGMWFSLDRA